MAEYSHGNAACRIVLKAVPAGAMPGVVQELAKLLGVDAAMAARIVRAVPVTLADGLSAEDAALADTNLARLRRLGVEVEVQSGPPAAKMPRLNWSVAPPFLRRADAALFTCPHCGARLSVRVHQAPAPPKAPPQPKPVSPEEAADELAHTKAEPAAPAEPPPVPVEAASSSPAPPAAAQEGELEPLEVEDIIEVEGAQNAAAAEAAAEPTPASVKTEPAPPAQTEAHEVEPGPYNVYAGTLKTSSRRAAVPLIMKYRSVSEKDAQEIAARTIVFVAEGVSAKTAEECAKEFQAAGIKVRVRKR